MHRLPPHIVSRLNEALRAVALESACFDGMEKDKCIRVYTGRSDVAQQWPSVTDMIREKVELHHSTWIAGPIKSVLEWSENANDRDGDEWNLLSRLRAPLPHPQVLADAATEIERLQRENDQLKAMQRAIAQAQEEAAARIAEINTN